MNGILAFDIGGANIKAANPDGYTASRRFALWKNPERLSLELGEMLDAAPAAKTLAVTMTGELADCFFSKREGVDHIIAAVRESAADRSVFFYKTDGAFSEPNEAREAYALVAASNWHALATYAARFTEPLDDRRAVLVDVGSTTSDIIPVEDDRVVASGKTDTERLLSQELVYMGVERTPICAMTSTVPYRDQECPLAREVFATTLDVFLLAGDLVERPENTATADGRPATRKNAMARLARCICADAQEFGVSDGVTIADFISLEMSEFLRDAIQRVLVQNRFEPDTTVILSGHGEFLGRRAVAGHERVISLSERLGPEVARCATAYALANLAAEVAR